LGEVAPDNLDYEEEVSTNNRFHRTKERKTLMKASATVLLLILLPLLALAQAPNVVSTSPANDAVNVPVSTTVVSLTFDTAVDTTTFMVSQDGGPSGGFLTNLDSLKALTFSADHKTVFLSVALSAGKPYFVLLFYARSAGGPALTVPYIFRFTTGASFPTTSVSGTVNGGATGISPANSMVIVNDGPLGSKDAFIAGAVADGAGAFTIPYVPNGTFYPVAAKSLGGNGQIDPTSGDPVGTGAPITVSGANVTGVSITLRNNFQRRYQEAMDSLNHYLTSLPSPRTLRMVQAYRIDSTGAASEWEFRYTRDTWQNSFSFRVELFGARLESMDSSSYYWLTQNLPISSLPSPAVVDSFLARAERGGGYAYRPHPMDWNGFDVHLAIGNLYYSEFWKLATDPSQFYLGVSYWYGIQGQNQSTTIAERLFLGDYNTGTILGTTGIAVQKAKEVPQKFSLEQNYPNPFNPSTTIRYGLPHKAAVSLVVYNALGQQITRLVDAVEEAGYHEVRFDGSSLPSGVYFYRLEAEGFVSTYKLVLLK
jgi:hypothetical protein